MSTQNKAPLHEQGERKKRGRWKAGESGNPAGRVPGSGEVAKLRAAIAEHVPGIIAKLVEQAKAGDVGAARLLMERAVAPLKAIDQPAPMSLPNAPLAAQGLAAVAAAAGELTPPEAVLYVNALAGVARLVETDDLAARIAALEKGQQQGAPPHDGLT